MPVLAGRLVYYSPIETSMSIKPQKCCISQKIGRVAFYSTAMAMCEKMDIVTMKISKKIDSI